MYTYLILFIDNDGYNSSVRILADSMSEAKALFKANFKFRRIEDVSIWTR